MDFTVTVTTTITAQRISDLLCSAFEGGSNYWYTIKEYHAPAKLEFRSSPDVIFRHLDYPLNEGGGLTIGDIEDPENVFIRPVLNRESIALGLQIMADKYPKHFGDFTAENDDAETGDVFLQCCLMGEIVYG
jgi:hypothetical protein